MATPQAPAQTNRAVNVDLIVDEKAPESLALLSELQSKEQYVLYMERIEDGQYFLIGDQSAIQHVCDQYPLAVMKLETV